MAKVLHCKDVGMDCDFVARAETEQEILQQAVIHAQATHGMHDIPPEIVAKVRSVIYEE